MVEAFARWVTRRPVAWAIVVLTMLFGAASTWYGMELKQDDDVLAFLPAANPDIQAFNEINAKFGSTDVALVGIPTDDPFDAVFLERLQRVTTALRDTKGLDSVLTLTNVSDFVEDKVNGGIITDTLIHDLPTTPEEEQVIRDRVMSRDHIVGTLISKDADAVLVYAFATPGQQPREIAESVRKAVEPIFPETKLYWGGAPFYSTWIYETSQRDIDKLTPWSIATKLGILLVAFRDPVGTLLGLLVTAFGLMASRAAMYLLGVPFNVVLSSMPVILFATGSAYAIHILSYYNQHARVVGRNAEAVVRTLVSTGPTTLVAGLTTVAGLASFVTMDIVPMQTFGVFTGLGLFVALVLSLTFVPAVITLWPRPDRGAGAGPLDPFTRALAKGVRNHRGYAALVTTVVAGVSIWSAEHIEARMDLQAFFTPGSEPEQAEKFLHDKFGGSQFIQILIEGDLEEPESVREIGRIADRLRTLPAVSGVTSVEDAIGLVGEAMVGARRVPDTRGQVGSLYRFLGADRASTRLVTDDRKHALMQVKLSSADPHEIDAALDQVEALIASEAIGSYKIVTRADDAKVVDARAHTLILARIRGLATTFGVTLPDDLDARLDAAMAAPVPTPDPAGVSTPVRAFLTSTESWVTLTPEQATAVADAVAVLPADVTPDAMASAIAASLAMPVDAPTVGDLMVVLEAPLADFRRMASADAFAASLVQSLGVTPPEGDAGRRFVAGIASKLQDRSSPDAMVATDGTETALTWSVNGSPVLYRGLSKSVLANLYKSMFTALGLVVLIISVLFRSLWVGLLAASPTAITLAIVYGGMGVLGIPLDIGTSMVASLILGAGVDYAVHFLWNWDAREGESMLSAIDRAVDETCHGIWTNGIAFAMGFSVLALGDARALQNVGSITAVALLVAAFATFILIPLLANRRSYLTKRS